MGCADSRLFSLILRAFALFFNVIAIILFGVGFPAGTILWIILYAIVAIWSIVDLILVLCNRPPHPGVLVGLDLVSWLILGVMAIIGCGFYYVDLSYGLFNVTALRVGVILAFMAAVIHLVLFVRACINTHTRRRESRKTDWEMSHGNRV